MAIVTMTSLICKVQLHSFSVYVISSELCLAISILANVYTWKARGADEGVRRGKTSKKQLKTVKYVRDAFKTPKTLLERTQHT